MKKISLILIILLIVTTSSSIFAVASASNPPIFSDTCLDSSKMAYKSDSIIYDKNMGFYRSNNDDNTNILYKLDEDIGDIEVLASIFGGFDGYTYAQSINSTSYSMTIYVSDNGTTNFEQLNVNVIDTGNKMQDGARSVIKITNKKDVPKGKRYIKFAMDCSKDCGYFIALKDIKVYKNDTVEEVTNVLIDDDCSSLSNIYKKEGDIYANATLGILRYTSMQPLAFYYKTKGDIGNINLDVSIYGTYKNYQDSVTKKTYSFKIYVSSYEDYGYSLVDLDITDSGKTIENGARAVLNVKNKNLIDSGKKYLKILLDNSGATYFVSVRNVFVEKKEATAIIDVESVTITNTEKSFKNGESLEFNATKLPINASFNLYSFNVFSDSECQNVANGMYFDANILYSNFAGINDSVVYVVAELGGIKSSPYRITVLSKPDVSLLVISGASDINEGSSAEFNGTISPKDTNNINIEWEVFDDASCNLLSKIARFDNNKLCIDFLESALTTKNYVRAKIMALRTETYIFSNVIEVSLHKLNFLVNDDATSLAFVNQKLTDMSTFDITQNMIIRKYDDNAYMSDLQYCVLGLNSKRTDKEKQDIRSLYYKTYGDISSFRIDAAMADYNKDAHLPTAKPYFGYIVEVFVSTDSKNWVYIPSDYEVVGEVNDTMDKTKNSLLTFFNKGKIPTNCRYLRIDVIGQIGFNEMNVGTVTSPKYQYSPYSGVPLTENKDSHFSRNNIAVFYNTYAPFIAGVKIIADKDTIVDDTTVALKVDGMGLQIRKDVDFVLDLQEMSARDVSTFKPVTDFSSISYDIITGHEFLEINNGSNIIKVKQNYTSDTIQKATFKILKQDAISEVVELNIVIPVQTVTLNSENSIEANKPLALSVSVFPTNASFQAVSWIIVNGEGAEISPYGIFTCSKENVVTVKALVDGVCSEIKEINVRQSEQKLSITKSKEKISVGDDVSLFLGDLNPIWEIVDGSEFAFLDGNVLKARSAGSVKIRATINGQIYEDVLVINSQIPSQKSCGANTAEIFLYVLPCLALLIKFSTRRCL